MESLWFALFIDTAKKNFTKVFHAEKKTYTKDIGHGSVTDRYTVKISDETIQYWRHKNVLKFENAYLKKTALKILHLL